jgi:uncharacterized protein YecE (DUF72 family)
VGQVRVGTASWTDRTLLESGWYPPEADTPEQRLRYYARQFALVEVDATYYALPGEQTAALWAARTPDRFTFNVKAFSLFTHHPTPVAALPADLRPAAEKTGKERVYFQDVGPAVADAAWGRFAAALEPLRGRASWARSCCSSRRGSRSRGRARTTSCPARSGPRRTGCAQSSATGPG